MVWFLLKVSFNWRSRYILCNISSNYVLSPKILDDYIYFLLWDDIVTSLIIN